MYYIFNFVVFAYKIPPKNLVIFNGIKILLPPNVFFRIVSAHLFNVEDNSKICIIFY